MVEIIKGTFGFFDGRRVIPVSAKDGPQSWDPDLEQRLVARGIARYVGEAEEPAQAATEAPEEVTELQTEEVDISKMTVKQLKAVAEQMGIDAKSLRKKSDLIAAIEDAAPPAFDAEDAIV